MKLAEHADGSQLVTGDVMHLYSGVVDRVLSAAGRDHPPDVAGGALTGEVLALHDDSRHSFYYRHRLRSQRAFQVSSFVAIAKMI